MCGEFGKGVNMPGPELRCSGPKLSYMRQRYLDNPEIRREVPGTKIIDVQVNMKFHNLEVGATPTRWEMGNVKWERQKKIPM